MSVRKLKAMCELVHDVEKKVTALEQSIGKPGDSGRPEILLRSFRELAEGCNKNTITFGVVIGVIPNSSVIPYTFCLAYSPADICVAVTVYNFSEHFGVTVGQWVAVLQPIVNIVNCTVDGTVWVLLND
ncbi:unnamed protein product [Soboliphyme baturini]|uniref:TTC5_OB domain-containing protein n=1 Tax=Soboliphyme baturini TaxID=241478 RepID=A0A183IPR4_9BILA|nr:unnamed protein product [Soboliphyme baturini]